MKNNIMRIINEPVKTFAEDMLNREFPGQKNRSLSDDDLRQYYKLPAIQIDPKKIAEHMPLTQPGLNISHSTDPFIFTQKSYFTLNHLGYIKDVNVRGVNLLGYDSSFLINKLFAKFILPEDRTRFVCCWSNLFERRDYQQCELRMVRTDGPETLVRLGMSIIETRYVNQILVVVSESISQPRRAD